MRFIAVFFFVLGLLLALNGVAASGQIASVIHQLYVVLSLGFGAIIAVLACILFSVVHAAASR